MVDILLVDDEPEIVFLTKKILEKEGGYQVVVAKDGEECFQRLDGYRPDLILLDIMMPGENGWKVCQKIKARRDTKDVPVVMFTVRTSEESVEKSLECADAQIDKPFRKEELLRVVKDLLKN